MVYQIMDLRRVTVLLFLICLVTCETTTAMTTPAGKGDPDPTTTAISPDPTTPGIGGSDSTTAAISPDPTKPGIGGSDSTTAEISPDPTKPGIGDSDSTTAAISPDSTGPDSTTAAISPDPTKPGIGDSDSTTAAISPDPTKPGIGDSVSTTAEISSDPTKPGIGDSDSTTAEISSDPTKPGIGDSDSTTAATPSSDKKTTSTTSPDSTTVQSFFGINLTYPLPNETIKFSIPEDQATGYVNKSVAVITLTTTGELSLNIDPRYENTTDQVIADDVQVFSFTPNDAPYYYLYLAKSLDYEVINMFSLLVTLVDSNVSSVTYTVTFNITITDVNDVAPVILNLPDNVTLKRDENAGYHIFTLNATDSDGTAENQVISYRIVSGNQDGIFQVDNSSGEVTLINDADQVPANVEEYGLTISAYSVSHKIVHLKQVATRPILNMATMPGGLARWTRCTFRIAVHMDGFVQGARAGRCFFLASDLKLENSSILTVSVPNNPPNCTHDLVWAYSLDLTTASAGHTVTSIDSWSCYDVGDTLTYNITSVAPNMTSAFAIDASTGSVSLSRSISSSEVPNRQIVLEITVKDLKNQTVAFALYMNVTTMTCLPNPRNLYVRMDQELGGVILDNFNCTVNSGLTFSMKQYPPGTFQINDKSQLILMADVVKIKFYSLTVTITHDSDVVVLKFKVIIQTRRCGVSGGLSKHLHYDKIETAFCVLFWTVLSRFVLI